MYANLAYTIHAIRVFTIIRQEVNAGAVTDPTFIFNIALAVALAFGNSRAATNTTFIFRIALAVALSFRDRCNLGAFGAPLWKTWAITNTACVTETFDAVNIVDAFKAGAGLVYGAIARTTVSRDTNAIVTGLCVF
jgi:hypothetical protein